MVGKQSRSHVLEESQDNPCRWNRVNGLRGGGRDEGFVPLRELWLLL